MRKLLIVEPYFSIIGHPATSVLSTARILGPRSDIFYLIALDSWESPFGKMAKSLGEIGNVKVTITPHPSPILDTIRIFVSTIILIRKSRKSYNVYFNDGHLVAVAALYQMIPDFLKPEYLFFSYMSGPERVCSVGAIRKIVRSFLKNKNVHLILRTEELCTAWQMAFADLPQSKFQIIPAAKHNYPPEMIRKNKKRNGILRFGIFGQMRSGKSIDWLVPLFKQHPEIGELHIIGGFPNEAMRRELSVLKNYQYFTEKILLPEDTLEFIQSIDYVILLFDKWDKRRESEMLFDAAIAGTPVIAFDEGWLGRMNREFSLGVSIPTNSLTILQFFKQLPVPGDERYSKMLEGLEKFRSHYSNNSFRSLFLSKMFPLVIAHK